jgi:hypothetical protein
MSVIRERFYAHPVLLERNKRTKHGGEDITVNYMKRLREPDIINYVKVKRLAWAGQLVRMNNDRTLKRNIQHHTRCSKKS